VPLTVTCTSQSQSRSRLPWYAAPQGGKQLRQWVITIKLPGAT
jgi:hypothetical protein